MNVCVLYPSHALLAEFGESFAGQCGVCLLAEDRSSTAIIPESSLLDFCGSADIVPYRGHGPLRTIPFEDEMKAYSLIRDEAAKLKALQEVAMPPSFFKPFGLLHGLLSFRIGDGRLDLAVSPALAEIVGWRAGDVVSLGQSFDKPLFVLLFDPNGHTIDGEDELRVSFPIDSVSLGLASIPASDWFKVACEIRDRCVYFAINSDSLAARLSFDRVMSKDDVEAYDPEPDISVSYPKSSIVSLSRFHERIIPWCIFVSRLIPV